MRKRKQRRARSPSAEEWVEERTPRAARDAEKMLALEQENRRLAKLLGLVESYHAAAGDAPEWMRPSRKAAPRRGTAVVQLSDLHLDENVAPAEMGGLNAYSREIAEMRLRRWADRACEMGELHPHEWDGALILWGGDMVSGAIHEELRETNADALPGTLHHWAPLLAAAIAQVAAHYGSAHVPGVVGNHGRLTPKPQFKRRARNSWDWLLLQMVASHLRDNPRVTWQPAEGDYLMVPIYEHPAIWLEHGDAVKGGGGWAGIWSPMGTLSRRAVELAASHDRRISTIAVGHWHSAILAQSRGIAANGSLKGYDEFARGLRLRHEAATQNWWVTTPRHACTVAGLLFVEDRKAEGW